MSRMLPFYYLKSNEQNPAYLSGCPQSISSSLTFPPVTFPQYYQKIQNPKQALRKAQSAKRSDWLN